MEPHRVIIATDFSDPSRHAAQWARCSVLVAVESEDAIVESEGAG